MNSTELENIRRLTPGVFRADSESHWCKEYQLFFPSNEANEENFNYCIDLIIDILLKKKEHERFIKYPKNKKTFEFPDIYYDEPVYSIAKSDSHVVHKIQDGYEYTIKRVVTGFVKGEEFYEISGNKIKDDAPDFDSYFSGYLQKIDNEETVMP